MDKPGAQPVLLQDNDRVGGGAIPPGGEGWGRNSGQPAQGCPGVGGSQGWLALPGGHGPSPPAHKIAGARQGNG
eukprot:7083314-Lingulodinium_polyedra.AAC.1